MRKVLAFWVVCALLPGAGCGPFLNATRTLVIEPLEYCERGDNLAELIRDRRLADAAWKNVASAPADHPYSADYERGFKDGYADYLYAGGTGAPPPVPPRDYWDLRYKTPEGHQAAEDWFAGFRHGAAAARDSGYRQLVTVPASVAPAGPSNVPPEPTAAPPAPDADGLPELPPPRAVTPPPAPEPAAVAPPAPSPPGPPAPWSGK